MNVLIATFSQFGTTATIGDEIAGGLQAAGVTVESVRIGGDSNPDFAKYDLIGIGTPAYMFRPPFPVTDVLRELSGIDGKPFFTFVLYGTHRGATGNRIRRRLRRAGGVDVGYFTARGADMFVGYLREGVLFSPEHPTDGERVAAREFGGVVAGRAEQIRRDAHVGNPPGAEAAPYDPPTPGLFALERASLNRFFIRTTLAHAFHADDRCICCGLCVKRCPTGNIALTGAPRSGSVEQTPEWGTNCLMCGVCALVCPVDAVRNPYDWGITRLFMKLNVRRGKRSGVPFRPADPADRSTWGPSL
jgi:flavodoxin/ferredoxin